MKKIINCTLIADGGSDQALIPIIQWTLRKSYPEGHYSQIIFIKRNHKKVTCVVQDVIDKYNPDIIFIHRDAEKENYNTRRKEIPTDSNIVAVIPVRMTETWLMINENAIRRASDNPNGTADINLPKMHELESIANPKDRLKECVIKASGKTGRRLKRLKKDYTIRRIAELITNYQDLHQLNAYKCFYNELEMVMKRLK